MPRYCAVNGYNNSKFKAANNIKKISFFKFPKEELKESWIRFCNQPNVLTPRILLCSSNFKDEDFEDDIKSKLLDILRKKFKKNSIPSVYLYKSKIIFYL